MPQGQKLNGHPGRESVRETSAHDTGQRGYRQSSLEIEFLDNRLLLLKRHFALFVDPGTPSGRNPQQTNENTSKNYTARGGSKNLGQENAAEDRGHQSSKSSTKTQHDSHSQRESQVAHRQAKRQSADTPQESEEDNPKDDRSGSLREDLQQVSCEQHAEKPWRDAPAKEAPDQPIGLPGPSPHTAVGHIEACGGQTAEPVEENTESRIWGHRNLERESDMKHLFQWRHRLIWQQAFWLNEKSSHFSLPACVDLSPCHAGASFLEVFGFQITHQKAIWAQEERVVVPAGFLKGSLHLRPDSAMSLFVFLDSLGFHLENKADAWHGISHW